MRTNQDYKNAALGVLSGNWASAVVATIIYLALSVVFSAGNEIFARSGAAAGALYLMQGVSLVITIFILSPVSVGYNNAFRLLYERGDDKVTSNLFHTGFGNYLHVVWVCFVMTVYIILWTLLLIIPGIIKSFAYAMTPYILVENPELSANEAIKKSEAMMKGHKFDLFYLYLSFIGWILLSLLTLCIGFIWLLPYMNTATVAFYNDLKAEQGLQGATVDEVKAEVEEQQVVAEVRDDA